MPTVHTTVRTNDPFRWGFSSNTVNLRAPQVPIQYVLWLFLKNLSGSTDLLETTAVTSNNKAETPGDYRSVRVSLGELCNTSALDDSQSRALRDLIVRVLGERSANRFTEITKIRSGWDFGRGEALHERAIANLSALLSRTETPPPNSRLFLTTDGSLELRWQSEAEGRISIFVKNDRFEVFKAESDEESVFMESEVRNTLQTAGLLK
jgi:hypothetical protein